jgi:sigma-B regulation protein RsbU (phosphoserine phosphatase)
VSDLAPLVAAFHSAVGCGAVVWAQAAGRVEPRVLAATHGAPQAPAVHALPTDAAPARLATPAGAFLVRRLDGPRAVWVGVGPIVDAPRGDAAHWLHLLAQIVRVHLHATLEVEQAAAELAERYEEINLLYTISEILGRTVTLEEAARVILAEISETVGASRGAILVHDRVTDTLQAAAVLHGRPEDVPPVAADDPASVSARVFRTGQARMVDGDDERTDAEAAYRDGAMLSVPILWTAPDGATGLGVVNLSGRTAAQHFTAGDQKLVTAIATQIGTAIQNTRLVRASLSQQRLVQEMQLAHDLQMKLLPSPTVVAPDAVVDARVVPAESVGGDFYHLFPLGPGRTGVMIGDVSGHGYRAALIMALSMSAAAIHAQSTLDPGAMLAALLDSLREELTSTEMFITACYAVIDRDAGELHYANAGHPHAFVVTADGAVERLPALDPPLGMVDDRPAARRRPWAVGRDMLLLFTDGVSDARDRRGRRLGEQPTIDAAVASRADEPSAVAGRILDLVTAHVGDTPLRDDLTLVVVRS